jgi:hypothetical protein
MEIILNQLYRDPIRSPAAFAGVDALWNEAKKIDDTITKRQVRDFLAKQRTYTVHHPRRVRLQRAKTVAAGYLTDVQCDLADFQNIKKENDGFAYLLVTIDVLSKRVFVEPIRNKAVPEMQRAFEAVLARMEMYPHRIYSDKGREFAGERMREFFEEKDIQKHQPNSSTVKASLAENCIRRLKQRLYRYMTEKQTLRWVDIVQKVANGINHSKSRVLGGLRPIDVSFHNARDVRAHVFGPIEAPLRAKIRKLPRYKPGEYVLMSKNKPTFAKERMANYDDELLQVHSVKPARMPYDVTQYKVKDETGDLFDGYFYEPDLQRVHKPESRKYVVERMLESKKDSEGRDWYLVKLKGEPRLRWLNLAHADNPRSVRRLQAASTPRLGRKH